MNAASPKKRRRLGRSGAICAIHQHAQMPELHADIARQPIHIVVAQLRRARQAGRGFYRRLRLRLGILQQSKDLVLDR